MKAAITDTAHSDRQRAIAEAGTGNTRQDWQEAVADGKTELGLVEWLALQETALAELSQRLDRLE